MSSAQTTPARAAGAALIVCALASAALLAGHPAGGASPLLADVLRSEAAQRLPDAIVHGGFVLVLAIELVGFAALAVRLGAARTAVLAATTFFLIGAGLLAASMIVDGLITPAVAARYATAPLPKQEAARALFVLIGEAIRVLMPMGLAFQGAAALAWGTALIARPAARTSGAVALAAGAAILLVAAASLWIPSPHLLMLALLAQAAWTLTAGVVLWRGLSS
jgi:hypothetical protein